MTLVGWGILWVVWRRSYVLVSERGVGVGLWQRRWLAWPDIHQIRCGEGSPVAAAVVAELDSGESVILGGVPFYPLLFDTVERHNRAVAQLLIQLEEARPDPADGNS